MKRFMTGLAVLLTLPLTDALAITKRYSLQERVPISQRGVDFRVEIVSDTEGLKPEDYRDGRSWITARKNERYAIRLYNPLPVRVAVNLTVDGLNTISGKPSGISDGEKWLIDPYGVITLRGWQVNGGEARRFFFTDKRKSYAKWQGNRLRRNLSENCGVIGAAYFWNQAELDRYYASQPIYLQRQLRSSYNMGGIASPAAALESLSDMRAKKDAPMAAREEKAGTGMGERESNPTTRVDFHYDTGMYSLAQAVVIYYDFASEPMPNPFPELGYAPEMP